MPSRYPVEVCRQIVELARSGTKVSQLAETFGMSKAVIYGWLKQERIDRGEAPGLSTQAMGPSATVPALSVRTLRSTGVQRC